jgi:hypothetical protein
MTEMCLDLKTRHDNRAKERELTATETSSNIFLKRACSKCGQVGHRRDNKLLCTLHADYRSNVFHVAAAPLPTIASTDTTELPIQTLPAAAVPITVQLDRDVFNAQACFDQFSETATQFIQRLQLLNFKIHRVPGTGECFWTSVLLAIDWMKDRNPVWRATVAEFPKNALEMRFRVVAFMRANIDKVWMTDQPGLTYADTFGETLRDEFRYGVLSGATGVATLPRDTDHWFELMSEQYAYTSTACIFATAFYFQFRIKVWFKGARQPEVYSSLQNGNFEDSIDPDTTVCLMKADRAGHFDACQWVAPALYVPNIEQQKGQGRKRQNRYKAFNEP